MKKHTSGLWSIVAELTTHPNGKSFPVVHIRAGNQNIAQVLSKSNDVTSEAEIEEKMANASLIAAAPALLAACLLLAAEAKTKVDQDTMCAFGPAFDAALKAIEKAGIK